MDIHEAEVLPFIANSAPSVPAPEVFRAETFEDGVTIIEMQNILEETFKKSGQRFQKKGKEASPNK